MRTRNNNRSNFSNYNLLPPARILGEYENIAPGSVNKLLEMAKKEQEHRHSWQDRYLKSHGAIYRLGQIFGFAYNVLLLYIIFKLVRNGDTASAIKIFAVNALLIIAAIIITFTERKITTKKPPRRTSNQGENNKSHQHKRTGNSRSNNNRDNRGNRDGRPSRPTHGDKGGY